MVPISKFQYNIFTIAQGFGQLRLSGLVRMNFAVLGRQYLLDFAHCPQMGVVSSPKTIQHAKVFME